MGSLKTGWWQLRQAIRRAQQLQHRHGASDVEKLEPRLLLSADPVSITLNTHQDQDAWFQNVARYSESWKQSHVSFKGQPADNRDFLQEPIQQEEKDGRTHLIFGDQHWGEVGYESSSDSPLVLNFQASPGSVDVENISDGANNEQTRILIEFDGQTSEVLVNGPVSLVLATENQLAQVTPLSYTTLSSDDYNDGWAALKYDVWTRVSHVGAPVDDLDFSVTPVLEGPDTNTFFFGNQAWGHRDLSGTAAVPVNVNLQHFYGSLEVLVSTLDDIVLKATDSSGNLLGTIAISGIYQVQYDGLTAPLNFFSNDSASVNAGLAPGTAGALSADDYLRAALALLGKC